MQKIITDESLRVAAALVRDSMLSSLNDEYIPDYRFSDDFMTSIEILKKQEKRRQKRIKAVHRCIAAILTIVVGITLFFTINTRARAAAIGWIKKTFFGQTVYSFPQDTAQVLPNYQLTWLPEGMQLEKRITTPECDMRLYTDVDDPNQSFTIQCNTQNIHSNLTISYDGAEYTVYPVQMNGFSGEMYQSNDENFSHGLVWLDEDCGVSFAIVSYLDPNVILHIAEGIKLE